MIGTVALVGGAEAATCESLRSFQIAQTTITSVEVVAAGPFVQPGRGGPGGQTPAGQGRGGPATPAGRGALGGRGRGQTPLLPAHCRVTMVLKPSADSHINVELWMPAEDWNGKFLAVGNGGFAGAIQGYGDMQTALRLGYATAGTDTGHSAEDGPVGMFGLGHPEKIVDFAYRAVHEMTVKSKQVIQAFYDRTPQYSYFKGCSTGGRQAVMSAQRYPADFDGIIAGALANRHVHMHTAGLARQVELARNPDRALPQEQARLVNDAVMNACDTMKEGFLNNPRACRVDFSSLACKGTDGANCLTAAQLQTVQAYYGGVKNGRGELVFSGQALGNPIPALPSAAPAQVTDTVRIWAFQNPDYDWRSFDLDRDLPFIDQKVGFVDAVDPDLGAFKARGGKLFLYAGWGDTAITPENTVLYYESVLEEMGRDQGDWLRLFMIPGMGHCGGGPGPNTFDAIGTLEAWREQGVAPARITAANGQATLTRPVCPYPEYATYNGRGNVKDAATWSCTAPE
jgi:feruloyl esterase